MGTCCLRKIDPEFEFISNSHYNHYNDMQDEYASDEFMTKYIASINSMNIEDIRRTLRRINGIPKENDRSSVPMR